MPVDDPQARAVDDMRTRREGLRKLRVIADFQFGPPAGKALFPDQTRIEYSARTGRIRRAIFGGKVLATLIPATGLLALTPLAAQRFVKVFPPPKQRVVVEQEAAEFVSQGRSVFARHVISADPELRPNDEVIVTDGNDRVMAVGKALLSPEEMLSFKIGVAVKNRAGIRSRPS